MNIIYRNRLLLFSSVFILAIGIIDYITTSRIKVNALYLIPIFIMSYYFGIIHGMIFVVIGVIINVFINYYESSSVQMNLFVNNIMILSSYSIVAYLAYQLKKRNNVIEKNLGEKEIIIRDIHHRMKNQISSLLSIIDLSGSEDTDAVLNELSSRLHAYVLLYDNLCYDNESQSKINIIKYLNEIMNYIILSKYGNDDKIDYSITGGNFSLENKAAISIGLLINELITNSLKYAFSELYSGTIEIDIKHDNSHVIIIYRDNGKGFDYNSEQFNKKIGILLIQSLVEQFNGTIQYTREQGSEFKITLDGMQVF